MTSRTREEAAVRAIRENQARCGGTIWQHFEDGIGDGPVELDFLVSEVLEAADRASLESEEPARVLRIVRNALHDRGIRIEDRQSILAAVESELSPLPPLTGRREVNQPVSPRTLELWCARLEEDLGWLYQEGRSPAYRWIHSGLDGIRSPSGGTGGIKITKGSPGDSVGSRKTLPEYERCLDASRHVEAATKALRAARELLETKTAPQAGDGPRFLTSRQLNELHALQAKREERGGFGAS